MDQVSGYESGNRKKLTPLKEPPRRWRIKTYFRWAIWAIAAIVVWLAGILLLYGILYLDWVSIFGIRCDRGNGAYRASRFSCQPFSRSKKHAAYETILDLLNVQKPGLVGLDLREGSAALAKCFRL